MNLEPPSFIESLIYLYALPLQLLVFPWMDMLQRLGLTTGEWIRVPTFLGTTLVAALYVGIFFAVHAGFGRIKHK